MLHTLKTLAVVTAAIFLTACASGQKRANDLYANSVKVTNTKGNHGGTGIVLRSSDTASLVLTNSHVCGVVEEGGLVSGRRGQYMVTGYKKSQSADLCLVKVAGNLGYNTAISSVPPELQYEKATISGHPGLMPNVQTRGHFSGRDVIQILVGMKKCTEEDIADEHKGGFCLLFGGLPIVKQYESILVTATIMPGSSGSGVYNSRGELAGVAFAGSGSLGYAWTVPYEAMKNFLRQEAKTLEWEKPSNVLNLFGDQQESKSQEEFLVKLKKVCASDAREKFQSLCALADEDMTL